MNGLGGSLNALTLHTAKALMKALCNNVGLLVVLSKVNQISSLLKMRITGAIITLFIESSKMKHLTCRPEISAVHERFSYDDFRRNFIFPTLTMIYTRQGCSLLAAVYISGSNETLYSIFQLFHRLFVFFS